MSIRASAVQEIADERPAQVVRAEPVSERRLQAAGRVDLFPHLTSGYWTGSARRHIEGHTALG